MLEKGRSVGAQVDERIQAIHFRRADQAAHACRTIAALIAKIAGCRTVGIAAGTEEGKICVNEFGYDTAVDYKSPTFQVECAPPALKG